MVEHGNDLKEEDFVRRFELADEQWDRIKGLLPGREGTAGCPGKDNRLFLDAVLWIARTGAPWRDLPDRFGEWNTIFQRFNRWAKAGRWQQIFETLQDPDLEWVMIDATIIRAHVHAAGAEKKVVISNSGDPAAVSGRKSTPSAMAWATR